MRLYRYRCLYRWNKVMLCDFEFNEISIKQARKSCQEFAKVNERIRKISCEILKVTRA